MLATGSQYRAARAGWALTALLATVTLVGLINSDLPSLHLHKGLRRGTIGYARMLKDAGALLPPEMHATLYEDDMQPGRIIVIGDVHGCLDELKALLHKLDFVEGNDTLVFAGDIVDKGPDSVEVLRKVRHLGALSVRGNHEDAGLAAWEGWQQGGGLKGKHKWVGHISNKDAEWLYRLPWSLRLPSHSVTIVHAGLVPDVLLERQSLWNMYQMRGLVRRSHGIWIATDSKSGKYIPWAQRYDGPDHVLFGHDSRKGLQDETYATGLDTGCVGGGRLTACVLPPAAEVRRRQRKWPSDNPPVTLEMLGGTIVSVPSQENYLLRGACNSCTGSNSSDFLSLRTLMPLKGR